MLKTSVSRWSRIQTNIFEVMLSVFALSTVVVLVAMPSAFRTAAIEIAFGRWAYLWLVGYATAAVLILAGIWRFRRDTEAAGLVLLATAAAINGIAIVVVFHLGLVPTLGIHAAIFVGCAVRAKLIIREEVEALLSVGDEGESEKTLTTSFEDQESHNAAADDEEETNE